MAFWTRKILTIEQVADMEPTELRADPEETNAMEATVIRKRRSGGRLRWLPLVLATLWLLGSAVVGIQLIQQQPAEVSALRVQTPSLSASSDHAFYGGDAYTGIQNAASDTEHAVVDGVNQLATFQLDLQRAVAEQDRQRAEADQALTQKGLGFLVIGLGVLTFIVALSRAIQDD